MSHTNSQFRDRMNVVSGTITPMESQCLSCANYLQDTNCIAYPMGVPIPIYVNQVSHKEPYKDDNGVLYQELPTIPIGLEQTGEVPDTIENTGLIIVQAAKSEKHKLAVRITKSDSELQVVYGEVYTPDVPDSQNEIMTKDVVRETAYRFMINKRLGQVDTNHDNEVNGSMIVESFIARDGDPDFIPHSWVVGVYIPDPELWERVKNQDLNGFSLEAIEYLEDCEIELEVPDTITGTTSEESGHTHTFYVRYDDEGNYLGGETNLVNGHQHIIKRGTVTEKSNSHEHRYSYIDEL